MLTTIVRHTYFSVLQLAKRRFQYSLQHMRRKQDVRLKFYTKNFSELQDLRSLREFRQRIPISTYSDYAHDVQVSLQAKNNTWKSQPVQKWETTSGSTHAKKIIPYTKFFSQELNRALSPWMADLTREQKQIKKTSQYWSLSWSSPEQRNERGEVSNNDADLFPPLQRFFLNRILATDPWISLSENEEKWLLATLEHLVVAKDLGFISVWSPTYLLVLLRELNTRRNYIAEQISESAPEQAKVLRSSLTGHDFYQRLWPQLKIISCWTSSTSAYFSRELQSQFPTLLVQPKGVWATEGVVTIPFERQHPLAVDSHFYEFIDVENEKVFLPEELKVGQVVEPIISSGNGFWRYRLGDQLRVNAFVKGTDVPSLEFLGRTHTMDLVGEKLSYFRASSILNSLRGQWGENLWGWFAVLPSNSSRKPYYALLGENLRDIASCTVMGEAQLSDWHHYQLARKIGQLGELKTVPVKNASQAFQRLHQGSRTVSGHMKIEPIITITEDELEGIRNA